MSKKRPKQLDANSKTTDSDVLATSRPAEFTLAAETLFASPLSTEDESLRMSRVPLIDRDRYIERGYFGQGGMGKVMRVFDRVLGREVAMKTIHTRHAERQGMLERFIEEAQVTAQLQHPSIIPLYDLGRFEDGRLWFTMKEVSGQTLKEAIREVHQQSETAWQVSHTGWHLRKLISVFARVCEAIAYAHERGVVHRDLKPDNIMLGSQGEVWVVDWGLVKVLTSTLNTIDRTESSLQSPFNADAVVTDRSRDISQDTRIGAVSGTPAYMSPEQSRGDIKLDMRTDVYSLGAILYEILCGHPPYRLEDAESDSISLVRQRAPLPVEEILIRDRLERLRSRSENGGEELENSSTDSLQNLHLPDELVQICEKSMHRERSSRYLSVQELLGDLSPWLEGTMRRTKALRLVQQSEELTLELERLSIRAQELRKQAKIAIDDIEPWRDEEVKAASWALEDEASALETEVITKRAQRETLLRSALQHSSDLIEAHLSLAAIYREEHERAEKEGEQTINAELALRESLSHLPMHHPAKREYLHYLKGDGAFSLVTDPPGAEVVLFRYELYHRRLIPKYVRSLGLTPILKEPLEPGSYLCKVNYQGRRQVLYPVYIERGQHWDGVPPQGKEPTPIYLPREDELDEDECYIPAGWFWSGGDSQSPKPLPKRRLWCDALVYKRFNVTNHDFMAFLHDLVERGEEELAIRYAPREDGTNTELSTLIYHYADGVFSLKEEEKWAKWRPDWPVYAVDWFGANAFAQWESQKSGKNWRLPGDLEWEKVVRGVDGRCYPWGDFFDPSWACMRDSHPGGTPSPASVYDFPYDESVYGVRGVSGNARIWCVDVWYSDGVELNSEYVPEPERGDLSQEIYRTLRGGSWYNSSAFLRACYRFDGIDKLRFRLLGFRLARRFEQTVS